MEREDNLATDMVITVHGIRTFGNWQDRLAALLQSTAPAVRTVSYGYGYFSAIAFAIPFLRWIEVRRFRARLLQLFQSAPSARISIVAHSFGTHIVAMALRGISSDMLTPIKCVLLCGSVLRSDFDWSPLLDSGKVQVVVNDCGVDDNILLLSQCAVLFTGMAGRVGFYGFTHERLVNRFFAGGHSHYFQPLDSDPDSFMRRYWVPLLLGHERARPLDKRPPLSALRGAAYALMRFADPIKLAVYVGIGGLIAYQTAFLPRQELRQSEAHRRFIEARGLLASDLGLADAVGTLVDLTNGDDLPSAELKSGASVLARYGMQRLAGPTEILSAAPEGSVFLSNGQAYLRAGGNLRLPVEPRAAFVLADQGVTILLREIVKADTRDTEIRVVDAVTGQPRSVLLEEHAGWRLEEPFVVRRIPSRPNQLLIGFMVTEIDGDHSRWRWRAVDLLARTERALSMNRPVVLTDCSGLAEGKDEDDEPGPVKVRAFATLFQDDAKGQPTLDYTKAERLPGLGTEGDSCTVHVPPTPIVAHVFPSVIAESTLFSAVSTHQRSQPGEVEEDTGLCGTDEPAGLGPISETLKVEDANAEAMPDRVNDSLCRRILKGPSGIPYVASLSALGQWTGGWTLCELKASDTARRCGEVAFPSEEHGGLLWHTSGSAWIAVRMGRTGAFTTAFTLVRLSDRKRLEPDESPAGYPVDLVIDEERGHVVVAASVPGSPLSTELLLYRLEAEKLSLIARRRFDRSGEAAASNDLPNAQLFRAGALVVLALPSESLMGIDVAPAGKELSRAKDAFAVRWALQSAGLGTTGMARVWVAPDGALAALTAGSRIRLLLLRDGTMFTPPIDLATLSPSCGQRVQDIRFDPQGTITIDLSTCTLRRSAPPASVSRADYLRAATLPIRDQER